ncbi:MAG: hypothetical protein CMO55_12205 [Verrucomicrobiales bacterium]|nr:hypothetical protein [Verrucomicrobiales bacterium]
MSHHHHEGVTEEERLAYDHYMAASIEGMLSAPPEEGFNINTVVDFSSVVARTAVGRRREMLEYIDAEWRTKQKGGAE